MNHHKLPRHFDWLRSHELRVVVGTLIVVIGAGGFIVLANLVAQGHTQDFDDWGVRDLRCADNLATPIGPHWLTAAAQDVTALGGVTVLFSVTAAAIGFFALSRKFTSLGLILAVVVGGLVISLLLKTHFERPRPHLVPYLCAVDSSSFPSGHSMMSVVVYLTGATLLSRMTRRRRLKLYLLASATLLAGLIGASRIYLGVHYPTDIMAGWIAGLVWVAFCWLLARRLHRPGAIDASPRSSSVPSLRA
jgi:undecaprenyl-diphosphatase